MEILDPLGFLLGSWRVERRIEDYRSSVNGTFDGIVTFAQLGDRHTPLMEAKA